MLRLKPMAISVAMVLMTTGCATQLKLHYESYSIPEGKAAEPTAADANLAATAIMNNALDGEQLFPLSRTNIFIVPTASLNSTSTKSDPKTDPAATPVAAAIPPKQTGKNSKASGGKADKKAGNAKQNNTQNQQNETTTQNSQKPTDSASPPKLLNPFATATIDGVSWSAVAVPTADESSFVMVKGTNTLFHSDTLSLGHPDNSDIVSSINSKAVNNTSTLITTAAGVVAAFLPIAGISAAAKPPSADETLKAASSDDLNLARNSKFRPAWIRVPDQSVPLSSIPNVAYWYYTLDWSAPRGTVKLQDFLAKVKDKDVSIFPVPACINATLSLYHDFGASDNGKGLLKTDGTPNRSPDAMFFVTVETPAFIRPYQVPAVGTVTMGSVCGASSTDSSPSESDTTQEIIKSLSSAATTINTAVNKNSGGKSGNSSSAASGSSSNGIGG